MSSLAIDTAPHGFRHSMVDAMSKPFNTWAPEPYAHTRYYPRELSGPGQRLPPPSSLISSRHSSNPLLAVPREAPPRRGPYQDPLSAISPRHHSFSHPSPLGAEPYGIASLTGRCREDVGRPRLSPPYSITSERPEEVAVPDTLRLRQLIRDPGSSSSQLPRLQPPLPPPPPTRGVANGYAPEPGRPYGGHTPPSALAYGSGAVVRPEQQQQQERSPHRAIPATPPTGQWPGRLLVDSRPPPPPPPPTSASSTASERMRISDLLSSNSEMGPVPPASSQNPNPRSTRTPSMASSASRTRRTPPKQLTVRQQPAAARSCGFGERDRRVIDPPPIVQLRFLPEEGEEDDGDDEGDDEDDEGQDGEGEEEEGKHGLVGEDAGPRSNNSVVMRRRRRRSTRSTSSSDREAQRRGWIRHPYAVIHCAIWSEAGDQDVSMMPEDYRPQRRLMGTVVSSSFVGLDENGEEGCFFCFPDLSCRTPGSFRLKFSLVLLDPAHSLPGSKTPVSAEVMSAVFTVYNAKDFPGMQASTPLTKRLKEQGCLISIKKGNEKGSSRHDRDGDSDDDDDFHDAEPAGRGRKRQRRQ